MDLLAEIINLKRERLTAAKRAVGFDKMRDAAHEVRLNAKPHMLLNALQNNSLNIIAEFKRRSPSKGIIRSDANLSQIVKSYQSGGAAAISVLTEEDHFSGSLDDLREAKTIVRLPGFAKTSSSTNIRSTNQPPPAPMHYY